MSLEDQAVMLDEEDMPDIRIGQDGAQMPEDMISVQDYNAYDSNTETDNERSEEEATLPHSSSEIKDRTDKFQKEKAQYEEKEDELQRRERLVKEQEYDLENRRAAFHKVLQENEERERSKMRKRLQEEMYGESLRSLKDLELDLNRKKMISEQKEKDLIEKERELLLRKAKWEKEEKEMENAFRERLQREVAAELSLPEGLPTSTPRKATFFKQEESPEIITREHTLPDYSMKQDRIAIHRTENADRKNMTFLKQEESSEADRKRSVSESIPANAHVCSYSREIPEGSGNFEKGGKGNQGYDSVFVQKPDKAYVGTFSGAEPRPKNEGSFDVWRMEVESLMASNQYSDFAISQAIRKSLRVLLTMSATASARDIISKLENVYGDVACGQAVIEEFYTSGQGADENVADWAVRLHEILKRAEDKGQVKEDRNEILRTKFWRGLYSQDLKNATKIYFESEKDFEDLLVKVRTEDGEMRKPKVEEKKKNTGARAQHNPIQGLPEQQIDLLTNICGRMEAIEKSLQYRANYDKQNSDNRGRGRGKRGGRGRGRGRGNNFDKQSQFSEKENQASERDQTVPKQPADTKSKNQ